MNWLALRHRWARLERAERKVTSESAVVLGLVSLGLRLAPSRVSGAVIRRACMEPEAHAKANTQDIDTVVRGLRRVARHVPASTCLAQAVAGWLMLRRRAVPSVVRIGIGRPDGKLSVHAWLEQGGRILVGAEDQPEHTSFPSFPPE